MTQTNQEPSGIEDSLTTRELSKLLGLAIGTIQQMYNRGEISGWKTPGGHRRISKASVEQWLSRQNAPKQSLKATQITNVESVNTDPCVLIIEDSTQFQILYSQLTKQSLPQHRTIICGDAYSGLISIGRDNPDIILLDLMLPGIDGFSLLGALKTNQELENRKLIVITQLSNEKLKSHEFLFSGIQVLKKSEAIEKLPQLLRRSSAQK